MKKITILLAIVLALSTSAFCQKKDSSVQKLDTVVQVTLTVRDYQAVMTVIDQNIDSKKLSKEILEFFLKNAKLVAIDPKEKLKK